MTPPALDRVVKTCLAKDPEDRFQTAHDAKLQLQWIVEGGSQAGVAGARGRAREEPREARLDRRGGGDRWPLALAAARSTSRRAGRRRVRAFVLPPEKSVRLRGQRRQLRVAPTVSPDGRFVTFATIDGNAKVLLASFPRRARGAADRRDRGRGASRSGRPTAASSRSSPDGKLQKVDVSGAPAADGLRRGQRPQRLLEPRGRHPLFAGLDDTALPGARGGRRAEAGNHARHVPRRDDAPLGRRSSRTGVTSSTWRARTRPERRASRTRSTSERSTRMRRRCSCRRGRTSSTLRDTCSTCANTSCSRSGSTPAPEASSERRFPWPTACNTTPRTFAACSPPRRTASSCTRSARRVRSQTRLTWMDRAGKAVGEPFGELAEYSSLSLSDDGKRIAAAINDPSTGAGAIWLIDERGARTRLTFGEVSESPVLSHDGSRVAFASLSKQGVNEIHAKSVGGSGSGRDGVSRRAARGPERLVSGWSLPRRADCASARA